MSDGAEMCREAVPKIGCGDWVGTPLADGSEVEGRHYQLVGIRRPESQSRWHVSKAGEVGRQVR